MRHLKIGLCRIIRIHNIIIHTGAGLLVICGENTGGRGMGNRLRLALYLPQSEVHQDLLNHNRGLDECNDPHGTGTLRARQRINLVNFLYQPRPVFSESLVGRLRLKNAGNVIVRICSPIEIEDKRFPPSSRHVTIIAVIPDHLFPLIGYMGTHRGKPFQGVEHFRLQPIFPPGRILDDRSCAPEKKMPE